MSCRWRSALPVPWARAVPLGGRRFCSCARGQYGCPVKASPERSRGESDNPRFAGAPPRTPFSLEITRLLCLPPRSGPFGGLESLLKVRHLRGELLTERLNLRVHRISVAPLLCLKLPALTFDRRTPSRCGRRMASHPRLHSPQERRAVRGDEPIANTAVVQWACRSPRARGRTGARAAIPARRDAWWRRLGR